MGGLIGTINIPSVKPGGSVILEFPWNPPNPADYDQVANYLPKHFCLYARIESSNDPMVVAEGFDPTDNTTNNNNIVWKNIVVLDDPLKVGGQTGGNGEGNYYGSVYIANPNGVSEKFDLEFLVRNNKQLSNYTNIKFTLPNELYDIWVDGGELSGDGIELINEGEGYKVLLISSDYTKLENLLLPPNSHYPVAIEFNFVSDDISYLEPEYKYSIIQKYTSTQKVIGSEHYIIRTGNKGTINADAGLDRIISKGDDAELSALDIGQNAIYNWYDSKGELIYTGEDFIVTPEITERYKLEVIATIDGVVDIDEVEIKVKEFEILNVSPNPASTQVNIDFRIDNANSAYLMITQPYGSSNNYILDLNQNNTSIDVSSYQTGVYNVVLVVNGQATDASTLIIQ
jgi:hypothetical protein